MAKLLLLCDFLVKLLIQTKLEDSLKISISKDFVDFAKQMTNDAIEQRQISNRLSDMASKIASSCKYILEDYKGISDARKEIIIELVKQAVKSIDFNGRTIFQSKREVSELKNILASGNRSNADSFDLDEREQSLYFALLAHASSVMINAVSTIPAFKAERQEYVLAYIDESLNAIAEITKMLQSIDEKMISKSEKYQNFEREYCKNILTKYSYIKLFGSDEILEDMREYKLSTGYVQLEVEVNGIEKSIPIDRLFNDKRKKIWLSGEAGSGKTTCISWIASQSAQGGESLGLKGVIPVVIELRRYKDVDSISLKECIQSVMSDSSYVIPQGWIEDKTETGRFIFLLDGFDEIISDKRKNVLEWITKFDSEDKCYHVYSSRPQVRERPKSAVKPVEARIQPMKSEKVEEFIRYWHKAVLEEQMHNSRDDVFAYINNLLDLIKKNDSLRKLATNPLLCAMLSVLHYKTGMNIPYSKRDLYEACCKMLINDRDRSRQIGIEGINLSYERKKIIMSRLAHHMVINRTSECDKVDIETVLGAILSDMGVDNTSPQQYLEYLLMRTGLIQEPEKDRISFIHKSFQEYLCACELYRQAAWGMVNSKIGKGDWLEIISLFIGFANIDKASEIIKNTLSKDRSHGKNGTSLFYALEYLSGANEVYPEIRKEVEKRVEAILPPKRDKIVAIAKAGNIAVPYLKYKKEYRKEEVENCLTTLRMIGTSEAFRETLNYIGEDISTEGYGIIADFFDATPKDICISEGVPQRIKNYLESGKTSLKIIPEAFIYYINLLDENQIKSIACKMPKSIAIVDYNCKISYFDRFDNVGNRFIIPKVLCDQVEWLSVEGNFEDLRFLNEFNNTRTLKIFSHDSSFEIDKLREYVTVHNIKELVYATSKRDAYISGASIEYLKKCEKLALILSGEEVEVHFDDFDCIPLKELFINSPYALDFDYWELSYRLSKLKLQCEDLEYTYLSYDWEKIADSVIITDGRKARVISSKKQ